MIVVLLLISAVLGVWTYWPQILEFVSPGPKHKINLNANRPPSKEAAPKLRTVSSAATVQPRVSGAPEGQDQPKTTLLTEDATPEEPEGNLPEKLNTIKISEGDEIKRLEKQLVAQRKTDEPSAIWDFLRMARISGVRVAGPMSKLLFNGQVYEVGESVRDTPRITIQKITTAQVIFSDLQGNQYPIKY